MPQFFPGCGFLFYMTYAEQLQTPEWKAKRQIIINRDMGMCQHCLNSKGLDVHHKYYLEGKMAWDYPDAALITLCNACHLNFHQLNTVPVKQSSLDEALERLVNVCTLPKDFGLEKKDPNQF